MSLVLIVDSARPPHAARAHATLPIRRKLFGAGRDDWNRDLRELKSTIIREGWLSRLPDDAIRLHGLPGMDLRLDAVQADRVAREGLQISSAELEIEVGADAFAQALASLRRDGNARPRPTLAPKA